MSVRFRFSDDRSLSAGSVSLFLDNRIQFSMKGRERGGLITLSIPGGLGPSRTVRVPHSQLTVSSVCLPMCDKMLETGSEIVSLWLGAEMMIISTF